MPQPTIYRNETIDVYTDAHLVAIVTWVASDGLLRTDTELLALAMSEMGFQRRGSKIVDRLERAIEQYHGRK